jgi:preprotein translocase subunit SecA
MFEELGRSIHEEVVLLLFHAEVTRNEDAEQQALLPQNGPGNGNLVYEHESLAGAEAIAAAVDGAGGGSSYPAAPAAAGAATTVVASEHEKVGRNDPCWCGSGKKFKRCHGA